MRSEADEALSRNPDLNCPGFEVSRVFALLQEKLLGQPASGSGKGGFTRKQLLRNVNTIFQFVVLPTEPIDPENPRTRPTKQMSGGALRPALWYVDLRKTGTIGRGYPPNTVLGRKRKADVTIECSEYDRPCQRPNGLCNGVAADAVIVSHLLQPIATSFTWRRDNRILRSSSILAE